MWVVAVMLCGCKTPYQTTMGFTGGVEATPMGNGVYVVRSAVNGYTSQGTAMAYAYRRAGEICPYGYQLADSATSSTSSYWRTQYGVQQVNKPEVTIVVQCTQPAVQATAPAAAPPVEIAKPAVLFEEGVPVFLVDHWYFCFASKAGPDLCAATKELCEQWMASMGTGAGCVPAPQGVCFHTSKTPGGKADFALCFRTPSECKQMTDVWIANKANDPITMGCTVFRSDKAPAAPASAAAPKRSPRWWCTKDKNGVGACYDFEQGCEYHRTSLGQHWSPCAVQRFAACFPIRTAGGNETHSCAPDLDMCKFTRGVVIEGREAKALGECEIAVE